MSSCVKVKKETINKLEAIVEKEINELENLIDGFNSGIWRYNKRYSKKSKFLGVFPTTSVDESKLRDDYTGFYTYLQSTYNVGVYRLCYTEQGELLCHLSHLLRSGGALYADVPTTLLIEELLRRNKPEQDNED